MTQQEPVEGPAVQPVGTRRVWMGPLVVFVVLAIVALAVPPLVSVPRAEWMVRRFTYAILLLAFGAWIAALVRIQSIGPEAPGFRGEAFRAGALIGLFSTLAISSESFRCKVIYDEFVLQGTALNLHNHRIVSTFAGGYRVLGEFLPFRNYLDKRPSFYPFLVSLVHDLTGYRPANAFLLNALIYPVALVLAYLLGRRLHGPRAGGLAVVLLGTLPLLGQNATGSGMDLLNICMILVVLVLAGAYLRQPDSPRLTALVLGAVLLAHTRYESALFILPVALIVVAGWRKRQALVLGWTEAAAPILLLPITLQAKVMSHTPTSWELGTTVDGRFGVGYLLGNLKGAAQFLFSASQTHANSLVLTVLGLTGILGLGVLAVRRRWGLADLRDERLPMLLIGLGILGNTGFLMFYFWSRFDDPMAARLSLPLHLVLVFAAVLAAGRFWDRLRFLRGALVAASLLATLAAAGRYAKPLYSTTGAERVDWELEQVSSRPGTERLVLCNRSPLPWVLREIPALRIEDVPPALANLQRCLRDSLFEEVLVVQAGKLRTPGQGDQGFEALPEERLPETFELEPLTERRFGSKIIRISRLVAIRTAAGTPVPAAEVGR